MPTSSTDRMPSVELEVEELSPGRSITTCTNRSEDKSALKVDDLRNASFLSEC